MPHHNTDAQLCYGGIADSDNDDNDNKYADQW